MPERPGHGDLLACGGVQVAERDVAAVGQVPGGQRPRLASRAWMRVSASWSLTVEPVVATSVTRLTVSWSQVSVTWIRYPAQRVSPRIAKRACRS